jgi:hypothetical protein
MRRLIVIPVLLGGLLLAACDKKVDPGLPTAQGSGAAVAPTASASGAANDDDPVAYARCMRAHGQNVADPQPGQSWNPQPPGKGKAGKDAHLACAHLLPGEEPDVPTAQELEKLRAFAVCMRSHDVPMDDPVPNQPGGGKMRIHGRFEHITRAQLNQDRGWQAALTACEPQLPDSFKNPGKAKR